MIRLISGVYGAEDGMKRPKDGPFSLTDNAVSYTHLTLPTICSV